MSLKCHHCDQVSLTSDHITISQMNARNKIVGTIYFHQDCFVSVAGEEYIHDLAGAGVASTLTTIERELVENRQHIQAIKLIRQRTGVGLKEAKELADEYRDQVTP